MSRKSQVKKCEHKNEDWPYCEECGDEQWTCLDCGESACDHFKLTGKDLYERVMRGR